MTTIGERLKGLINSKGVTAYEVSSMTGISEGTISRIINKNSKPNLKNSEILAKYFNISRAWLMTGNDENTSDVEEYSNINVSEPFELEYWQNKNFNHFIKLQNGQYIMTMPLAGAAVQAGFLDNYQDLEYLSELPQHSIIVDRKGKGRYVAFKVTDHSMDNGLVGSIPSDYIVSARELQKHHWRDELRYKKRKEWVIFTTKNKYPLLKQIIAHDVKKGIITCHSYNDGPEYNDFPMSLDDVQALFYVIDVSRGPIGVEDIED